MATDWRASIERAYQDAISASSRTHRGASCLYFDAQVCFASIHDAASGLSARIFSGPDISECNRRVALSEYTAAVDILEKYGATPLSELADALNRSRPASLPFAEADKYRSIDDWNRIVVDCANVAWRR